MALSHIQSENDSKAIHFEPFFSAYDNVPYVLLVSINCTGTKNRMTNNWIIPFWEILCFRMIVFWILLMHITESRLRL